MAVWKRIRRGIEKNLDTFQNRFRSLLLPVSWGWRIYVFGKNWIYDRGYLPVYAATCPVLSVGNLVAGGTGKTPLIHLLIRSLGNLQGVAILSRGYRHKESGLVLGDEGTLLQKNLPNTHILIGKDRVSNAKLAIQRGAKFLVLDDGLQQRRLRRDFELVVLRAPDLFGKGHFLPRGMLRDSPNRLQKADAIFVNYVESLAHWNQIQLQIRPLSKAALIGMQPRCVSLKGLRGEEYAPNREKVGLFSAIGYPAGFSQLIEQQGLEVICHWILADHEVPIFAALEAFFQKCQLAGATRLICTEKDAVKLEGNAFFSLPIFFCKMELEVVFGKKEWESLIAKISSEMNTQSPRAPRECHQGDRLQSKS